ncbi:hypothetical protein ABES58_04345 [Paenibacillus lautus]|uniref:hypothetical protein n=1 Tax=Paenibacillus lautus TaxID=1401 RepID=UPI003D287D99
MIPLMDLNKGDLRINIDFEEIEQNSNKEFADRIRLLMGRSWGCTFFRTDQNHKYYCVYLAVGFYSEKHDRTFHQHIYYCQYHIASGTISIDSFTIDFLNKFNAIGISSSN